MRHPFFSVFLIQPYTYLSPCIDTVFNILILLHILKHFYHSFRKGYYSINALGLCDHEQRFRYFSARFKGSSHDSRVLSTSSLLPEIEGSFDPERPRFILADKAYSASDSILVPFRESQLDNDAKKNFNKHHTQARLVIEHAFGQLKQRCVIFCISIFFLQWGSVCSYSLGLPRSQQVLPNH